MDTFFSQLQQIFLNTATGETYSSDTFDYIHNQFEASSECASIHNKHTYNIEFKQLNDIGTISANTGVRSAPDPSMIRYIPSYIPSNTKAYTFLTSDPNVYVYQNGNTTYWRFAQNYGLQLNIGLVNNSKVTLGM